MADLKDARILITGGSRGIGLAIAKRAAADGAHVAIAAKTVEPHPNLPGTIFTAAREIEAAGGTALPLTMDVRDPDQVSNAVETTVETLGGLDILVNNASAISLTNTLHTPAKRYDLMQQVNARGTFLACQAAVPHLRASANPHVLTLSPPLNMRPRWFQHHVAYSLSKYGMSMCVLGMAAEFAEDGIAFNALWPRTAIATAALAMLGDAVRPENCRTPEIVADAAWHILTRSAAAHSGHFHIDDEVLAEAGISDLSGYAVSPGAPLLPDFFLD